jgi:hypothetical protein
MCKRTKKSLFFVVPPRLVSRIPVCWGESVCWLEQKLRTPSSAKVRHKVGWMGGNEPRLEQEKGAQPPADGQKGAPSHSIFLLCFLFGGGGVEAKLRWDRRS